MSTSDRERPSWPPDEELPSEEELLAAERLARQTDRLLAQPAAARDVASMQSVEAGESHLEPAIDADEAAELAATLGRIHASHHAVELPKAHATAILDEALREVDRGADTRRRRLRLMPLLALAAALLLAIGVVFVGMPTRAPQRVRTVRASHPRPALPAAMLSRPSNDLLGRPIVDRAGASRRLDRVFASRLAGYRALRLSRFAADGAGRKSQ